MSSGQSAIPISRRIVAMDSLKRASTLRLCPAKRRCREFAFDECVTNIRDRFQRRKIFHRSACTHVNSFAGYLLRLLSAMVVVVVVVWKPRLRFGLPASIDIAAGIIGSALGRMRRDTVESFAYRCSASQWRDQTQPARKCNRTTPASTSIALSSAALEHSKRRAACPRRRPIALWPDATASAAVSRFFSVA